MNILTDLEYFQFCFYLSSSINEYLFDVLPLLGKEKRMASLVAKVAL